MLTHGSGSLTFVLLVGLQLHSLLFGLLLGSRGNLLMRGLNVNLQRKRLLN